jgi:hypothetical protein
VGAVAGKRRSGATGVADAAFGHGRTVSRMLGKPPIKTK